MELRPPFGEAKTECCIWLPDIHLTSLPLLVVLLHWFRCKLLDDYFTHRLASRLVRGTSVSHQHVESRPTAMPRRKYALLWDFVLGSAEHIATM